MLKGLDKGICNSGKIEDFYNFARLSLVKDEKHFDKFDLAFKGFFENNKEFFLELKKNIPKDWIKDQLDKIFTDEIKRKMKNEKDWNEVLKNFEKILAEQKKNIKAAINGLEQQELRCMEILVIIPKELESEVYQKIEVQ